MSLCRCEGCASICETDDDPKMLLGKKAECAFCRGEETYEQSMERENKLFRAMGAKWLKTKLKPLSRRTYAE